ncbi:MAG TPA: DUF932 domain-containing protein [Candidatus Binataceae bacterium]|nr:DUF932 domain-containing protein [Candidatus Binataceae bacterium]
MLMLHRGAEDIDYDGLRQLDTAPATATHVPIPHFRVVDLIRTTLGMYGHEIVGECHGTTEDGLRYFGLLSLRSTYTGYEDTVGLRNSHDRSFPVGIGFGSRVFVCDNLAFVADQVIKRKHTTNLKRDLPGIIGELIEPLALHREAQHRTFERYRGTLLSDQQADHAVLNMYREGIVNLQRVPDVLKEWEAPTFAEFDQRNAWRLFNAATFTLTGRVVENPNATPRLHKVIDGICNRVN